MDRKRIGKPGRAPGARRVARASGGGGGGAAGIGGTVIFIIILNVLSYVFNWGWYFY